MKKKYKSYLAIIIICIIILAATVIFDLPDSLYAIVIIGFIVNAIVIEMKNK
ncbi:hypothetical protein JUJ52_03185 [Virgibacillus sp. AGTR]|uniref:hypothetical protein n=1 Tax=Virgibacillus sp. AGTR TaxID=2812055 RepID=UPI001D162A3F|nr:hypothetical protein [Virgibacillus sp. AGTR]MCC2248962.1 hypothetical protein [Virgibacillus sp. AGTR]